MQENYIVGIYARLSRDDERAGESVSIENQKEMLSRYVREQGWTLYDYYCDDGVSGTTFDRPGLNRLVQDATDHKINLVLCKDLSRLGRDYIEAGKYTDFVFPSLGCRFIALNDGVDTLRKNNEMLVILKNVMNDLYARDTSSKIKAVKLSTFKSGKYVGCYAPLGYKKSEADKHVLEIDPVTAPVVRHIFDLRLQGYGFRKITLQLNAEKVPAPRSFYYMAEGRENLRGETPFWNDVTVKTILRRKFGGKFSSLIGLAAVPPVPPGRSAGSAPPTSRWRSGAPADPAAGAAPAAAGCCLLLRPAPMPSGPPW